MPNSSYTLAKTVAQWLGDGFWSKRLLQWAEDQRQKEELAGVAEKAMHRARFDPHQQFFALTDIGLIGYRLPEVPKLYRVSPVMTDTRWLRPFAEVFAHTHLQAQAILQILDPQGQPIFTEQFMINGRGQQRLLAKNWLPLEKMKTALSGRWAVVLTLNQVRVGVHSFEWIGVGNEEILDLVQEDGEISAELEKEVKYGKFRKMSLDELLATQED